MPTSSCTTQKKMPSKGNKGRGLSLLGFIPESPSEGIKLHHNMDDDSDALRLHDLNTINNAARTVQEKQSDDTSVLFNNDLTHFVASDASTVSPSFKDSQPLRLQNKTTKTRRRLQWRVGPLVKKPRDKSRSARGRKPPRLCDEGSLAEKTVKSYHTFHSTETIQAANNRKGGITSLQSKIHQKQNVTLDSPKTVANAVSDGEDEHDDLSDNGTVIEAYDVEEESVQFRPQRTIGLFLFESESNKNGDILHPNNPTESPPICTKSISSGHSGLPPRIPQNGSDTSTRFSHPDTTTTLPAQASDDDSSNAGGPLWQLARLQAISEGLITSAPLEGASPTMTSEMTNTVKKRLFSRSSNDSVASSSSQSQMELQQMQAERNLKAIHRLASKHISFGEHEEAIEVLTEILRGVIEMHGERHYRVGTVLHNISTVHMRSRNYAKAVEISQKAVKVRRDTLGRMHPDLAISYTQLGIAHMELDENKHAVLALKKALEIRKKTLCYSHPKIARLLNNIGCSLFELGELREAAKVFEEALNIQRLNMKGTGRTSVARSTRSRSGATSQADMNSVSQALLSIASTLCNLGSIKLKWKQYSEALVNLEEALLIQQSVLGDGHPTVLNTKDSVEFVDKKRSSGLNALSMQDFTVRKMQAVKVDDDLVKNRNRKVYPFNIPNPYDLFQDIMSLNKKEWVQILEEVGPSPIICKTCVQDSDDITSSPLRTHTSSGHDLHWI